MANMTFELIPLREVETGPVDYGFDWVNVGNNNTLWAHNPITQAVSLNVSSYERPHVSSEGWLFDFKLSLSGFPDSEVFEQCNLSYKSEFPLSYTFTSNVSSGTIPWEDGTRLVKSLDIDLTTLHGEKAIGQILLDSSLINEMLQKSN